ncbi:universal stress protein [Streptomyces sp. GC420]|uniref:universal stress protein n=1 Tax=Streptomyces sp. GC420 TaxID=2697568 RepID=UPI001414FD0D|nr:universal stress protein [Streptomyces sp. GC420]NBM19919.1 universal stress protein [Streptomyces sp. GC420]
MQRQLVAGIDGSSESFAAAHWAAREALRRGTSLRLVHAWEWHPHPAASVPADSTQRHWARHTLRQVEDSVRAAYPELHITEEQVPDPPVSALLTAAEQADLLVLGSRGLSGVAGFLVGSVSQRVTAKSPRPVVLVRAGEDAADEHFTGTGPGEGQEQETAGGRRGERDDTVESAPARDVVLGLDTARPCDELIEFAFQAARRRGAALHAVHAFSAPPAYAAVDRLVPPPGPELLAEHEHAVVATLRPWCGKFPGVTVTRTVTEGRPAAVLGRASTGAGLIVVGRRIRSGPLGARTGHVAHAVLHHADCPVAVVPHG